MNVRFLETFYWFARLKSVTKTAAHLRISQPVVSMRLATLKRDLGVELYKGVGKNFELTPAGKRILSKCEAIVSLSKELEADVRETLLGGRTIRIGAAEVVAHSFLPDLLSHMRECSLSASLITAPADDLVQRLKEEKIDIALTVGPPEDPALLIQPVCSMEVSWFAPPNLIGEAPPTSVHDLTHYPIIQSRRATYRYQKMREYLEWHGVDGADGLIQNHWIDVGFGMTTCAHLASRGVGITALPSAVVAHQLASGLLTRLDIAEKFNPWHIVAVSRKAARSEALNLTWDCVKKAIDSFRKSDAGAFVEPMIPKHV